MILKYGDWLRLYESSRSIREKRLILLSGPSASGKSYFAKKTLGAVHWYEDVAADQVLVGTDDFLGNRKAGSAFNKLVKEAGMPLLAELSDQVGDQPHILKLYPDEFSKWSSEASTEEKRRYQEIESTAGWDEDKCTSSFSGAEPDGRVSGMAWAADLLPASTVIFDDIGDAITNYYEVEEVLLFTPLDHFLQNILSRKRSKNPEERIDTNDSDTALYQYCRWYQASSEPSLDNKSYTASEVRAKLKKVGHRDPAEILDLLGVTPELESKFWITLSDEVELNSKELKGRKSFTIVNSRDAATGRAQSVEEFTSSQDSVDK